jgi:Uma2 family endonuclease
MAVIDRVRSRTGTARPRTRTARPRAGDNLHKRIEALKPGDVFSIDRPITVEEFCEYVSDEWHAELVDGVIYIMVPPSDRHEDLSGWLLTLLRLYTEVRQLGRVRGGNSGVQIDGTSLREPDLLFFRTERLHLMTERGVHGAPDLAIEIVDSTKARRDAVQKQARYEAIGIQEYWVIDMPQREVRQMALEEGAYRMERLRAGAELVARTVEGFHLQVAWLFQGPSLPSSLEVVNNLLAGG